MTEEQDQERLNKSDEDIARSTYNEGVSSSAYKRSLKLIPTKQLKASISLSRLMVRDGHVIKKRGRNQMCLCPFHKEKTPSFCVKEDDQTATCYGCGWYGDIFDYTMDSHNLDFTGALKRLNRASKHVLRTTPLDAKATSIRREGEALTKEQKGIIAESSRRLATDLKLCEIVASKRHWQAETVQKLAEEGSLGWHRGALAFNYDTGMKTRDWPHRRFDWEFGHPSTWRANYVCEATKIYICEGETDVISMLDIGMEEDPGTAVIGLASATSHPSNLPELLTGKDVILCMDNDEAGERAADKLIDVLLPVCASVSTVDMEGSSHE